MGLFKKLFGGGDQESDKKVEKSIEQVKSGEANKVYPILKPGNWPGIQAGALKQTIIGSQEDPQMVLAFGYDTPDNFVFLMPRDLEGKDPNQVLQDAYQNLYDVNIEFEHSDGMLFGSGNDFSAEKILDENHMKKAHEILGAEELLVSIPRRTVMMITARTEDNPKIAELSVVHSHTWNDDSYGNAPIMNAIFVVKEGSIAGVIPMDGTDE